jgi:hypothetical protein
MRPTVICLSLDSVEPPISWLFLAVVRGQRTRGCSDILGRVLTVSGSTQNLESDGRPSSWAEFVPCIFNGQLEQGTDNLTNLEVSFRERLLTATIRL